MLTTQLALLPNIYDDGSDPSNDENYTPEKYIIFFRNLFGCFDLDGFSCAEANQVVKASKYFTKEDDALTQDFSPYRNKYFNPPYSDMDRCIDKILAYKDIGNTLILVNSNTDSTWYQKAVQATKENGAYLLVKKRIEFVNTKRILRKQLTGKGSGNNKGQTAFCYGDQVDKFVQHARVLGVVSKVI